MLVYAYLEERPGVAGRVAELDRLNGQETNVRIKASILSDIARPAKLRRPRVASRDKPTSDFGNASTTIRGCYLGVKVMRRQYLGTGRVRPSQRGDRGPSLFPAATDVRPHKSPRTLHDECRGFSLALLRRVALAMASECLR